MSKNKWIIGGIAVAVVAIGAYLISGGGGYKETPASGNGDELRVYDWGGYEDPAFFPPYMEKYGNAPTFSLFAEEEEARAKMLAGFQVDISHPCSTNTERWRESGLMQPIDVSRIKYYKDINKSYRELKGFVQDGKVYVIPYDIGQTALTYNADKVPAQDAQSLQIFVNPKYKGKISLPDNVSDWVPLGLLATGTRSWDDIESQDDPRYQRALEWLRKAHQNNKFYWSEGASLAAAMKTGEVLVTWAWNETPIVLKSEGFNAVMNRDTKEGFTAYVCGYVLLPNAQNIDQAYDYFNAILSPKGAEYLVGEFGYEHANSKAMKEMSGDLIDPTVVGGIEKYVDKILFTTPISEEVASFMNEDFNKIKAGQ